MNAIGDRKAKRQQECSGESRAEKGDLREINQYMGRKSSNLNVERSLTDLESENTKVEKGGSGGSAEGE